MDAVSLMFQTGYLTIKEVEVLNEEQLFKLGYPNLEVAKSFNRYLLPYWLKRRTDKRLLMFAMHFSQKNFHKAVDIFNQLIAGIPHDWFRRNPLAKYEGYWASVFYMALKATGLPSWGEDTTNTGQIDMTIELKDAYVLLEFKIGTQGDENKALQQMKEKDYHKKYLNKGKQIILLALVFDKEQRKIVGLTSETLQ